MKRVILFFNMRLLKENVTEDYIYYIDLDYKQQLHQNTNTGREHQLKDSFYSELSTKPKATTAVKSI